MTTNDNNKSRGFERQAVALFAAYQQALEFAHKGATDECLQKEMLCWFEEELRTYDQRHASTVLG